MQDLTEEEYAELDERWTKTTPRVGPNGTGFVSRRQARLMGLDDFSIDYLITKSRATRKSFPQIIRELIRKEIAAVV